jgi:hypothetical protein
MTFHIRLFSIYYIIKHIVLIGSSSDVVKSHKVYSFADFAAVITKIKDWEFNVTVLWWKTVGNVGTMENMEGVTGFKKPSNMALNFVNFATNHTMWRNMYQLPPLFIFHEDRDNLSLCGRRSMGNTNIYPFNIYYFIVCKVRVNLTILWFITDYTLYQQFTVIFNLKSLLNSIVMSNDPFK